MKHLLLACILSLPIFSTAQRNLPDSTQGKIDQLFAHIDSTTPGYIVGVIEKGNFLVNRGYGMAHLGYDIPITSRSSFNIASLSKQFTAACIAILIMEGELSLTDNISQYLPDVPDYPETIQVQHLIYMTSGIPEYHQQPRTNRPDWSSLHYFTLDTAIAASFNSGILDYKPGSQWSYSNINYMLLTRIVEKVSGMPFSRFAKERLFTPLGMDQTLVHDDIFQVIPNEVKGYNPREGVDLEYFAQTGYAPMHIDTSGFYQYHRNSPHYGGSGVYTSLEDLKKWVDNFETRSFGGDAFYDLMHKRVRFEHSKDNDAFGLAFGNFNGHEIVWYEGGDSGFSSYMMRFPKNQLTIICLSNLGTGHAVSYANRLVDILVGDGMVDLK